MEQASSHNGGEELLPSEVMQIPLINVTRLKSNSTNSARSKGHKINSKRKSSKRSRKSRAFEGQFLPSPIPKSRKPHRVVTFKEDPEERSPVRVEPAVHKKHTTWDRHLTAFSKKGAKGQITGDPPVDISNMKPFSSDSS